MPGRKFTRLRCFYLSPESRGKVSPSGREVAACGNNNIFFYNNEGGNTFIELMVAITILAVVSIPVLGLLVSGYTAMVMAGRRTVATNLARECVEEIKARGFDYYEENHASGGGIIYLETEDPVENFNIFRREVEVREEEIIPDEYNPDFALRLLRINVEVFWEHRDTERSVTLESELTRRFFVP